MKQREFRLIAMLFIFPVFTIFAQGETQTPPNNNIQGLSWNPINATLAMAGFIDNEAGIWLSDDATSLVSPLPMSETPFNVLSVAWSPDGTKLAALISGDTYTYYIWDITTGNVLATFNQEGETSDFSIHWDPSGNRLVTTSSYTVFVRDGSLGQVIATLNEVNANTDTVEAVAWSIDENKLLVASGNNIIRTWDVNTATNIGEIMTNYSISSMSISPDGMSLAVAGDTGLVHIIDPAIGSLLSILETDTNHQVGIVEWNPNGEQVVGADIRGNITFWDVNSGQVVEMISGSSMEVLQDIAYSPYGGRLAYSTRSLEIDQFSQTNAEIGNQTLANGAVQIVVPDPSIERLQSIAEACNAAPQVDTAINATLDQVESNARPIDDFIVRVETLPQDALPPGCAADLLAVAEAIAQQS